jgi:hypothetical protein
MGVTKPEFVAVGVGHKMSGTQPMGWQLWIQEEGYMTSPSKLALPATGESREAVALASILDTLTSRHSLESKLEVKRPRVRVVFYPDVLSRLGLVLVTWKPGMGPQEELLPIVVSQNDPHLSQWDVSIASYRLVLEDAPEICSSGSSAEHSDHGEELTEICTESRYGRRTCESSTESR